MFLIHILNFVSIELDLWLLIVFFFFFGVDFKVIASCQSNLIFSSVDHNLYYFCDELIRLVVFFFKKKKKSNVLNSLYYWCTSSPYALFNFNWISYSVHFSQVLWFDHLFGVQLNQLMSWTILAPIFNQVSWYQTFFFFLWRLYNKFIFIILKGLNFEI